MTMQLRLKLKRWGFNTLFFLGAMYYLACIAGLAAQFILWLVQIIS